MNYIDDWNRDDMSEEAIQARYQSALRTSPINTLNPDIQSAIDEGMIQDAPELDFAVLTDEGQIILVGNTGLNENLTAVETNLYGYQVLDAISIDDYVGIVYMSLEGTLHQIIPYVGQPPNLPGRIMEVNRNASRQLNVNYYHVDINSPPVAGIVRGPESPVQPRNFVTPHYLISEIDNDNGTEYQLHLDHGQVSKLRFTPEMWIRLYPGGYLVRQNVVHRLILENGILVSKIVGSLPAYQALPEAISSDLLACYRSSDNVRPPVGSLAHLTEYGRMGIIRITEQFALSLSGQIYHRSGIQLRPISIDLVDQVKAIREYREGDEMPARLVGIAGGFVFLVMEGFKTRLIDLHQPLAALTDEPVLTLEEDPLAGF